jgi:mono/diheme cytochrome c family protein
MSPSRLAIAAAAAVLTVAACSQEPQAPAAPPKPTASAERGKYIVGTSGCNDCHTPGYFFGKPDMNRFLGGSEVGFEMPGLGVFHGPNLTPDKETGLGNWTDEQIITALRTGERPDGRMLAPIMPWQAFASFTDEDVKSVVLYLRTIPAVKNDVPGPFGPTEKPTQFVMKIVPPEQPAPALEPTPQPPQQ